jgi:hypothetical protein
VHGVQLLQPQEKINDNSIISIKNKSIFDEINKETDNNIKNYEPICEFCGQSKFITTWKVYFNDDKNNIHKWMCYIYF